MQVPAYKTRLYKIWANMKQRCTNPNNPWYDRYGGRGIKLYGPWYHWKPFQEWAFANGYNEKLEIERKDTDGNYHPDNCIWVTEAHQAANKPKRTGTKNQFIGVRAIHGNKWRAVIDINNKQKHLGVYATELEAARGRDEYIKANKLPHKLNFQGV